MKRCRKLIVFSYTAERRRDDLNKKLERASGARCNRRHLVAVVYAHIDVHTRVARDAGDVARVDEARVRLVRKRRIVITTVAAIVPFFIHSVVAERPFRTGFVFSTRVDEEIKLFLRG